MRFMNNFGSLDLSQNMLICVILRVAWLFKVFDFINDIFISKKLNYEHITFLLAMYSNNIICY